MEKQTELEASAPPPYYDNPSAPGYSNQQYSNGSATGKNPQEAGYYTIQTGYNQIQPAEYTGTNQQPTTVIIQVGAPLADPPPNYLVHSILNFLFCCWILGLVAIIKSIASKDAAQMGRREEAVRASLEAKKWNIYGVVGGMAFWVAFIIVIVVLLVVDW